MFATENSVSMFLVNVCSITFLSKCFVEERKLEFFYNCFPRCLQASFSKTSLLPPHPFDPLYFFFMVSIVYPVMLLLFTVPLGRELHERRAVVLSWTANAKGDVGSQQTRAASAMVMVTARLGRWTSPALGGRTGGRRVESPGLQIYRATCLGLALEDSRAVSRPGWGPPGRGGVDGGEREQASVASWREE